MTDSAPVAWQDIDGQRHFVDVSYVLLGNNEVGFTVGDYDHNEPLVIDPTLTWNTFLGGSGVDYAHGDCRGRQRQCLRGRAKQCDLGIAGAGLWWQRPRKPMSPS